MQQLHDTITRQCTDCRAEENEGHYGKSALYEHHSRKHGKRQSNGTKHKAVISIVSPHAQRAKLPKRDRHQQYRHRLQYEGMSNAADATTAPTTPFMLYPKNVDALRLTGPGVIWVSAIRLENSSGCILSIAASGPTKAW